jgi:hypothetical protein
MFRLPAVFTTLSFIPAVNLAQITSVRFTLNEHVGRTIAATRSINYRSGQVVSTRAFAESTGPCSLGDAAPNLEAWPSPKTFDETSSGVKFASLLFQPQFRRVRMWALLGHSRYAKACSLGENLCFFSFFQNRRPILQGFPDQLVA